MFKALKDKEIKMYKKLVLVNLWPEWIAIWHSTHVPLDKSNLKLIVPNIVQTRVIFFINDNIEKHF